MKTQKKTKLAPASRPGARRGLRSGSRTGLLGLPGASALVLAGVLVLAACELPAYNSGYSAHSSTSYDSISIAPVSGLDSGFMRGVDISMMAQIEACGGVWYDTDGSQRDLLDILNDHGVNWVRLRLWNNPVDASGNWAGGGNNDLSRTLAMAARAKAKGFKFLLDFHYSDTWTHPGQQAKPAAWADLSDSDLADALYTYTYDTLISLADGGALPDMVQIGNEIDTGMLLSSGSTANSAVLAELLSHASSAVRAAATAESQSIQVMIHLARGGRQAMYQSFFDMFAPHDTNVDANDQYDAASATAPSVAEVDFDVIGLSYYPYWHSAAADAQATSLQANLENLALRYGKQLVIAETGYAWTLDWADDTSNSFGSTDDETNGGYTASIQHQADVVRDLIAQMVAVPDDLGVGLFYWAPEWIPVDGAGWTAGEGESWENQAMFDFDGQALPSIDVFKLVQP